MAYTNEIPATPEELREARAEGHSFIVLAEDAQDEDDYEDDDYEEDDDDGEDICDVCGEDSSDCECTEQELEEGRVIW